MIKQHPTNKRGPIKNDWAFLIWLPEPVDTLTNKYRPKRYQNSNRKAVKRNRKNEKPPTTDKKVSRPDEPIDIASLTCKKIQNAICEILIRIAKGGNHGIIYRSDDTGSKTGCSPL
jgi:hypothetical protein